MFIFFLNYFAFGEINPFFICFIFFFFFLKIPWFGRKDFNSFQLHYFMKKIGIGLAKIVTNELSWFIKGNVSKCPREKYLYNRNLGTTDE